MVNELSDLATIAQLSDTDPLREQARGLIKKLLDETEWMLKHSTPMVKAQLIKSTVPQLVRALREERKESDELVEMRAVLRQIQEAMLDGVSAPIVVNTRPVAVEDTPLPARPIPTPPHLDIPQSARNRAHR